MPRFSIRTLLIATAFVALAIFAAYAETRWPRVVFGWAVRASLIGATIAAVIAKGEARSFCIGAAIAGLFVCNDVNHNSSFTQINQTIHSAMREITRNAPLLLVDANNVIGVLVWTVIGVAAYVGGMFGVWVHRKYHEHE
jgi:hypothetical protein